MICDIDTECNVADIEKMLFYARHPAAKVRVMNKTVFHIYKVSEVNWLRLSVRRDGPNRLGRTFEDFEQLSYKEVSEMINAELDLSRELKMRMEKVVENEKFGSW